MLERTGLHLKGKRTITIPASSEERVAQPDPNVKDSDRVSHLAAVPSWLDLSVMIFATVMFMLMSFLSSTPFLRIGFGLSYLLFVPGYALLTVVVNPSRAPVNSIPLALSPSVSIAVLALLGLLLNYSQWGISQASIAISLLAFVLVCSVVAFSRRRSQPARSRTYEGRRSDPSGWKVSLVLTNLLRLALPSLVIGLFAAVSNSSVWLQSEERFTEFFILNSDAGAPTSLAPVLPGQAIRIALGTINQETTDTEYHILMLSEDRLEKIADRRLASEERWEQEVAFSLSVPGPNRKVTFLLFKNGELEPYRSLHLWLTVGNDSAN